MAENIIKLTARFVHADSGAPLGDPGLRVRFYDRDALKDDLLGEGALSSDGRAEVVTSSSGFRSGLMGLASAVAESKPDVYCEVLEGGKAVYRSAVVWNINPEAVDPVTKRVNRTVDLGTFKFRRSEGLEDVGPAGEVAMRSDL